MREQLEALAREMKAAAGDALCMVASYGSVVRGDHRPGHSDVNVLVVLESADVAALDALAPVIGRGREELRLAPFVLARGELARAADSFAAKLADISVSHDVLLGEDLLAGLAIEFEHLRLAVERDLRNVALRLRRAYVLHARRPGLLRATLEQSLPTVFGSLRVLLTQRLGAAPRELSELLEAGARELGFDAEPVRRAAKARVSDALYLDFAPVFRELMPVVDQIVAAVDRLGAAPAP